MGVHGSDGDLVSFKFWMEPFEAAGEFKLFGTTESAGLTILTGWRHLIRGLKGFH